METDSKKTKVSLVECLSYEQQAVYLAVKKACDLIGGIERVVSKGATVLIKPCMVKASLPEEGVCTHPEVLRAVIRLAKKCEAKVLVGESHAGIEDSQSVYETCGVAKVCREEKVQIVNFNEAYIVEGVPIAKYVKDVDCFITVPKFKTHGLTLLTGAVKSIFGVVPGLHKIEYHKKYLKKEEFAKALVDIFSYAKPHLSLVDGIVAMEGAGPTTGSLRNSNLIIAGKDAVAVDAVLSELMGVESFKVLTTKNAHERGLGSGKIEEIEIVGEKLEKVKSNFKLPKSAHIFELSSGLLSFILNRLFSFKLTVKVNKCTLCEKCLKLCPAQAIYKSKNKIKFDKAKCKLCLCCAELCPQNAISPYKGILFESIGIIKKIFKRKK